VQAAMSLQAEIPALVEQAENPLFYIERGF
jgi:hypothetical protein